MTAFMRYLRLSALHDVIGFALRLAALLLGLLESLLGGDLEVSLRRTRFRRLLVLPVYRRVQRRLMRRSAVVLEVAEHLISGDVEALLRRKRSGRVLLVPLYRGALRRPRAGHGNPFRAPLPTESTT